MHRRRFLSSLGVVCSWLFAGCPLQESPDVADLTVINESNTTKTVTIEIAETADDETVLSQTIEVGASEGRSFSDPITEPGTYRIAVMVENGANDSYKWDLPNNDEAVGLEVYVRSNSLGFQLIAA